MPEKQHQGRSYYLNRAPSKRSKLTPVFIAAGFVVLILVVITLLYLVLTGDVPQVTSHYRELDPPDNETPLQPTPALLRQFRSAAACSDNPICAKVARETLSIKDATIVDATVASLLCNAVVGFHTSGLGGGFVLSYYRRQERTTYVLDARETSPLNISAADMCGGNSNDCRRGAKAAGTPGTLLGLHTLWQRWGKLPWDILLRPSIALCTVGYNMTAHMYHAAQKHREALLEDEQLREALFNPDSHTVKLTGSWIKPPAKLCDTLKTIALKGVSEFYEGVLGEDFALDVKEIGGLLNDTDLRKFKVSWGDVSVTQLYTGHTLYAPPTPHSGDLLIYTMNILNRAELSDGDDNSTLLTLHRMLETYKYAEALRSGLGDPRADNISQLLANLRSRPYAQATRANISDSYTAVDYSGPGPKATVTREAQEGGYSHLSLLAPDGDAVSVTSSIGSYFGAKVTSRRTGLVLNSALGDFSRPAGSTQPAPGAPNLPGPVKRPLSPASPAIVVNPAGDVQLVLGGTGGDLTTSALAQVLVKYLFFNEGLKSVVDGARIFSRPQPTDVLYERGFVKTHIQELYRLGHATSRLEGKYSTGVCAVARSADNKLESIADWRTDGEVYGL